MQIHHGLTGLQHIPPGSAISVGNFDGMHLGHRQLLRQLHELAGATAVVTFEPHPLTVLRPKAAPPRLTPLSLKHALLEQLGVDHLVVLAPTPEVLNLSAEEFFAHLMRAKPSHLVEGDSFTFGKGRGGSIESLRQWTAGTGTHLHVVPPVVAPLLDLHVAPVSSSLIRWLLIHGRARDAAICLGKPYTLEGTVIKGFQRGRTIDVPTANLDCDAQLVPADGVYVGRCTVAGTAYPAALSIGNLPTFEDRVFQIEAHLVGFAGDLYGQRLQVEVLDWSREQWKFNGLEALKDRLKRDVAWTVERQSIDTSKAIALLSPAGV